MNAMTEETFNPCECIYQIKASDEVKEEINRTLEQLKSKYGMPCMNDLWISLELATKALGASKLLPGNIIKFYATKCYFNIRIECNISSVPAFEAILRKRFPRIESIRVRQLPYL